MPRTLGGTSTLYLCKECHSLAPNTTEEELFHRWCLHQSAISRRVSELMDALHTFEITPDMYPSFISILQDPDFHIWCDANTSLHGHPIRGPSFTMSTAISALLLYKKIKGI